MTINQNLRDLRQLSGLTQEQVAEQVGITRQAISGYESGRTQPDLDMLVKLAEVYQADISDLLYGRRPDQRQLRRLRTVGIAAAVLVLLLTLAGSAALLVANTRFSLGHGGEFSPEIIRVHVFLSRLRESLQGLAGLGAWIGCIAMALMMSRQHALPDLRRLGLFTLGVVLLSLLFTIPLGLFDPVFALIDYCLPLLSTLPPFLLFLLYRVILGAVLRHQR